MKVLLIAGHGKKRNGTFDPGASGFIKKGEHKYMTENLFPAMKKYAPKGAVFHTAYNVYDYGNLATLAKGYDEVVEFHFDATSNSSASGGHVIVYSGFKPDKMDLALRDAIKNNVGIFAAYKHHGQAGISGRNNLQNVNIAANNGINYRLLELGFGTNKKDADYMLNNIDQYAKDLVSAIFGSAASGGTTTAKPKPQPEKPAKKSIKVIAKEVIDGKWGNGSERKSRLEKAGYNYTTVQNEVNALLGISGGPTPTKKTNDQIADEVIAGKWGNGTDRKNKLTAAGYDYNAIQAIVNGKFTKPIAVGDMVTITANQYYTGQTIPPWVKSKKHEVSQISGDKVLLGFPNGICSWVAKSGVVK